MAHLQNHVVLCRTDAYFTQYSIVPQVEGQLQIADNYKIIFDIPWGHQKVIISKAQNIEEALFYAHQTLSNRLEQKHFRKSVQATILRTLRTRTNKLLADLTSPNSGYGTGSSKRPILV